MDVLARYRAHTHTYTQNNFIKRSKKTGKSPILKVRRIQKGPRRFRFVLDFPKFFVRLCFIRFKLRSNIYIVGCCACYPVFPDRPSTMRVFHFTWNKTRLMRWVCRIWRDFFSMLLLFTTCSLTLVADCSASQCCFPLIGFHFVAHVIDYDSQFGFNNKLRSK